MKISGKNLVKLDKECGGHRIQRVPPTESKGRVHTSSVTVSVIDPNNAKSVIKIKDSDLKIEWFSGTGKGGQHRNKKKNSCKLIHIPTGLMECRQGRKRSSNLQEAKTALQAKIQNIAEEDTRKNLSKTKKAQTGSGMRGDKIRTYRFQDDCVTDHRTYKKAKCSKVMKGHFDLL